MKQQGITRTPLMEMTLGTRGTLSQRMSLPNPQVSFGSCHSRRSGIGKSETIAFQQLDVHERKRLCRAQTLRKHQISTAASTLPKTWLSMTINVNFANGVTRYSWGGDVVWLKDNLPSFKRTLRPPRLLLQYKKVWLVTKPDGVHREAYSYLVYLHTGIIIIIILYVHIQLAKFISSYIDLRDILISNHIKTDVTWLPYHNLIVCSR